MQFNPAPAPSSLPQGVHKRIARYVHSGNKVIQPTAVDLATGIFTTDVPIGLAPGSFTAGLMTVMHTFKTNALYREWNALNNKRLEIIDDYHFYVQDNNVRIASYPHANSATVLPSDYHFELNYPSTVSIDISGFTDLTDVLVKVQGVRNRPGWSAVNFKFTHDGGTSSVSPHNQPDGRDYMMIWSERELKFIKEQGIIYGRGGRTTNVTWNNTNGTWTYGYSLATERTFDIFYNVKFTAIDVTIPMANNFVVEIYDVGGA